MRFTVAQDASRVMAPKVMLALNLQEQHCHNMFSRHFTLND